MVQANGSCGSGDSGKPTGKGGKGQPVDRWSSTCAGCGLEGDLLCCEVRRKYLRDIACLKRTPGRPHRYTYTLGCRQILAVNAHTAMFTQNHRYSASGFCGKNDEKLMEGGKEYLHPIQAPKAEEGKMAYAGMH